MDILQFIFRSFWTFAGTAILLGMIIRLLLGFYAITLEYLLGKGDVNFE